MARNRQRLIVRPKPRTKMWIGAGLAAQTVTGATPALIGVLNAAALLLRPFTILRSRLYFRVRSDQTAATEVNTGVVSCQVVTDSATTAGIGSIPSPLTEPTADFFVYEPFAYEFEFRDATGASDVSGRAFTVDSKAMRKVGHDDDVAVVLEQRGAAGVTIGVEGRMLVQLH